MTDAVDYETDGAVARLTLDRPEAMNSLDLDVLSGMLDAFDRVRADDAVRAVTVRGAGGTFSAGADLELLGSAVEADDRETVDDLIGTLHEVMNGLEALPVPTLAVVEGFALAGGLELLLSCDLRVATEDATIADQHANYGLVAGAGGTQRLHRQIPRCLANELLYTGRRLAGDKAADWGLVNRAVPADELDTTVADLEARLAEKSRSAAGLTKELQRAGDRTDRATALDIERKSVVEHYFDDDAREGFAAFAADRVPEF